MSAPCSLLHSFPAAPLSSTQSQRLHPAPVPRLARGTGSCAAKLAANTGPSPEKHRDTGTASSQRDQSVLWGGHDTLQGRQSDTATLCFNDHLTSPLGLLLFALKPSSRGPAGCMSGLLRWPLRSACKQGRKGARLCSQGQEPCPSCSHSCAEPQLPVPAVSQQHPEALRGQSGALRYGQALGVAPCCAGSRGEQPPSRAPTGLRDTGMGTAGAWGQVTAPKAGRSILSQCHLLAHFGTSKKTLQGWKRRARSQPVPARMVGGDPCMESLSECPSHDALCACRWVTWPCPLSLVLPRALQRDEVTPAANLGHHGLAGPRNTRVCGSKLCHRPGTQPWGPSEMGEGTL